MSSGVGRRIVPVLIVAALFAPLALMLASASETTVFHETWDTAVVTPPDNTVWPNWTLSASANLWYNGDQDSDHLRYALRVFDQDCTNAVNGCSMRTSSFKAPGDNSVYYGPDSGYMASLRQTLASGVTNSINMTFMYMNADPGSLDVYVTAEVLGSGASGCGGLMKLLMTAGPQDSSRTIQFFTDRTGNPEPFSTVVGDLPALDTWYRVTARYNFTQGLAQVFVHDTAGNLVLQSTPLALSLCTYVGSITALQIDTTRTDGYAGQHYYFDELRLVDSSGPSDMALVEIDQDSDGYPDAVESVLCSRLAVRNLLNNDLGGSAGRCTSSTNYAAPVSPPPPVQQIVLPVPNGVAARGPDADNDGVPAYVWYDTNEFVLRLDNPSASEVRAGDEQRIVLDQNDSNANVPAPQNTCQIVGIPTAAVTRPDNDADGVPGSIVVPTATLCLDRSTSPPTFTFTQGDNVAEANVDPDDSDPNNPGVSGTYTTPNVITNVTWGPDADNDKIPAYKRVWHVNYTIDVADPTAAPVPQYGYTQVTMDQQDSNRNSPVFFLSSADADGDWIPTIVEPTLCSFDDQNSELDGSCNIGNTNYNPPSWFLAAISSVP